MVAVRTEKVPTRMDNEEFDLTPLTWPQLGEGAYATVGIPHQLDTRENPRSFCRNIRS